MIADVPAVDCDFGNTHALRVVWIRSSVVGGAGRDGDVLKSINGCYGIYVNGNEVCGRRVSDCDDRKDGWAYVPIVPRI